MLTVIGRRLGSTLLILLGVSLVTFLLLQLVPGDPARTILGHNATEESVHSLREELGLNESLPIQFFEYLTGAVVGDFGRSLVMNQSVASLMTPRLINTLILAAAALFVSVFGGVLLGVIAARRQYGLLDRIVTLTTLTAASLPPYWLGLVLISTLSLSLGLFPAQGMSSARGGGGIGDLSAHLILPAFAAALAPLAVIARLTRGVMLDTMQQDYIKTLRASGISEDVIIWKHGLRNSLPPVVNMIGLQAGNLIGGIVFVEVVFSWPGLGYQLFVSIAQQDMPMVQAGVLFIAVSFVLFNLVSDLTVGILDPRTRRRSKV